jgi:hypothetical protein
MDVSSFIDAYRPLALQLHGIASPGLPFAEPLPPANEEDLVAAEGQLRVTFDQQHREFLACANGWLAFSGTLDLLGTRDYAGSSAFERAKANLDALSRAALGPYRSKKKALLPIAVSDASLDVICMPVSHGKTMAQVIWFNTAEPDEYPSLEALCHVLLQTMPQSIAMSQNRERRPRAS